MLGIYGVVVLLGMALAYNWHIYWLVLPALAGLDMVLVAVTGTGLAALLARMIRGGR